MLLRKRIYWYNSKNISFKTQRLFPESPVTYWLPKVSVPPREQICPPLFPPSPPLGSCPQYREPWPHIPWLSVHTHTHPFLFTLFTRSRSLNLLCFSFFTPRDSLSLSRSLRSVCLWGNDGHHGRHSGGNLVSELRRRLQIARESTQRCVAARGRRHVHGETREEPYPCSGPPP